MKCCKGIGNFFGINLIVMFPYCSVNKIRLTGQTKSKCQNLSKQPWIKKLHDESIFHKAETHKCLLELVKNNRQYQMYFKIHLQFKIYGLWL